MDSFIDDIICRKIALKVLSNDNFNILGWRFIKCKDVIGFHGIHAKLEIDCQIDGEKKTLKCFSKSSVGQQNFFDGYWTTVRVFDREYYMLSSVLEKLETAVQKKLTATFYLGELNRYSLTEDLNSLGFERQRSTKTDLDHAFVALEHLAVFHAASLIIVKKSNLSVLDNFPRLDYEPIFNPREETSGVLMRTSTSHYRFLLNERVKDIMAGEEVEDYLSWYVDTLTQAVRTSDKFTNCVLHGDAWGGNIMYRYDVKGKPTEAAFVDFQLSRAAPPAVDFLMFLHIQMDLDEAHRLQSPLLAHYLAALGAALCSAGVTLDESITELEFRRSLMALAPFSACVRAFYTLFVHLPEPVLKKTLGAEDLYLKFMSEGYVEPVKEAYDGFPSFRTRVAQALKYTYSYYKNRHLMNND